MEIEKPFKCSTCSARFTNEDHLSVHQRRHEMSLNLKSDIVGHGHGQSHQPHSLDSFVDETPTPTRFFNCLKEVGLFQDLQNVNPFDESFAKASRSGGGTPSSGTGGVDQFDFSIALPSSATVVPLTASSSSSEYSLTSKRRYSDQDTLNTPQVLLLGGYNLSSSSQTATNFSSTTTTVLNPVPSGGSKVLGLLRVEGNNNNQNTREEDQKLTPNSAGIKSQRPKTSLKLNLSPITPIILPNSSEDCTKFQKLKDANLIEEPEKKTELLERNRAAASRSRQRRKQWVYNLESRCETLENLLAQARAENKILRDKLAQHANCDVTKSRNNMNEVKVQLQTVGNELVITKPSITTDFTIPSGDESSPSLLISKPKIPAKRGRPRKGQERRVQGFSCFTTTPEVAVPAKLPLLSLTSTLGLSTDE